jgi:DUF971 family protein
VKPNKIQVDIEQRTLKLMWQDGRQQSLSHQLLRQHCPCGFCRAKRLKNLSIIAHDTIVITAMYDQGYGVQICFDDSHQQGIFPWSYLYEMAE